MGAKCALKLCYIGPHSEGCAPYVFRSITHARAPPDVHPPRTLDQLPICGDGAFSDRVLAVCVATADSSYVYTPREDLE